MKQLGYFCLLIGTIIQILVPLGFFQQGCCSAASIPIPMFNVFLGIIIQLFGFVLVCLFDLRAKALLLDNSEVQ